VERFLKSAILLRWCETLVSLPQAPQLHLYGQGIKRMNSNIQAGLVSLKSSHSVDHTVRRVENLLSAKGITLFAVIDHSGEAEKAGFHMANTKLLIFGHPKAGTPIMIAAPSAALDFPLKLLVSEDVDGTVWLSYSSPSYLQARHNIPQGLIPVLTVVEGLANTAAGTAENL
jgi:uncharacterized protein (DUF302 family)